MPMPRESAMLKGVSNMKTVETSKRRIIVWCAAAAVLVALVVAGAAYGPELFAFFADGPRMQAWVDGQGVFAPLAMAR